MKTNYEELIEMMSWAYGEGYKDLLKSIKKTTTSPKEFQESLLEKCREMEQKEKESNNNTPFIQEIIEIAMWSFEYGNTSKLNQVSNFEPNLESLPQRLVEYVETLKK